MTCPACGDPSERVLESQRIRYGARRRRKECNACEHRWTEYADEHGNAIERPKSRPPSKPRTRKPTKLDDAAVLRMLTSDETDTALAREHGVSRQMVSMIRTGQNWARFRPEIPRREAKPRGRTCENCRHWLGEACDFGFPDPIEDGLGVAADCSMYDRK